MRRIARARPSPAAVIAVLALIAAMTTTAVAGQQASISISKQKVRTIAAKVAKKVTGKKLNRRFPIGAARLGTINTRSAQVALPPSPAGTAFEGTANCQPGEKVLSGGVDTPNVSPSFSVTDSQKVGEGWRVRVVAGAPGSPPGAPPLTVEAYCLAP